MVSKSFKKNMPNHFVFRIILEERKRKRGFGKRLEKCPFGRFLRIRKKFLLNFCFKGMAIGTIFYLFIKKHFLEVCLPKLIALW